MVGTNAETVDFVYTNGSNQNSNGSFKHKVDDLHRLLGKAEGDPLRIVGVGVGAWGSAFTTMLQDGYGQFREKVQIRIWRRPGKAVDRTTAEHLFEVINSREDVLRRLIRRCAYLKYVEARLGDRVLYADEILKDGFCNYLIDHLKFMIQIFDKLCQSFGGDVLETLFNSANGLANCSPETMSYWLWRFIFDEAKLSGFILFCSFAFAFIFSFISCIL